MNAVKAHDEKYTPGAAVVVVPKTTKEICELEQKKITETT
jgi:hypothetical protein